jgi:hypothetical protein
MQLEDKIHKYRSIERRLIELRNAKNPDAGTIRTELLEQAKAALKEIPQTLKVVPYAVYAPDLAVFVLLQRCAAYTIVFHSKDHRFNYLTEVSLVAGFGSVTWGIGLKYVDPVTRSPIVRTFPVAKILKEKDDAEELVKLGFNPKDAPHAVNP